MHSSRIGIKTGIGGKCHEMMAEEMVEAWIWKWRLALTYSGIFYSDFYHTQAPAPKARVSFHA